MAGDAIGSYWRETLEGIANTLPALLPLTIPMILLMVYILSPRGRHAAEVLGSCAAKTRLLLLCAAILMQGLAIFSVNTASTGVMSPRSIYRGEVISELSVSHFGLLTTLRLDISHRLFGLPAEDGKQLLPPESSETEPDSELETPDTPEPEPIVYKDNVLNIDFDALAAGTDSSAIKAVDEWVSGRAPT